jgi:molybdenum cofactor biosynthesis protein B
MKADHITVLPIRAAVYTVSTTRTLATDVSGKIIQDLLTEAGIEVCCYGIVLDRIEDIQEALQHALRQSNCIIFCGGTGLTHDDCTIEALRPCIQKQIDGFGELFRWMSFQEIGTSAILSRALAGIVDRAAVFSIPGSPAAVRLAVSRLIIPEIAHILSHAQR